jgi:hypothetical protein
MYHYLRQHYRKLLVFALLGVSVFSCSRSEPEISYGFIQLVYYQGESKPVERFSFFVIPNDEDGIENLSELYLYNDWDQLRWLLKKDDWITFEQEGVTWIGSRSIAMPGGESLPRGQYRAVLVNKGGEKTERNFSFDAPEEIRFPFPSLEIADGGYTVHSAWPQNRLTFYDGEGNYIVTKEIQGLSGPIADFSLPSSARTAALWAEDNLYITSAFTNVTPLR